MPKVVWFSASSEAATSGASTAVRACRHIRLMVRDRKVSLIAFIHEQPTIRPDSKFIDMFPQNLRKKRRARHLAHFADRALLELSRIAVLATVGPVLARVRLGNFEDNPSLLVVVRRKLEATRHLDPLPPAGAQRSRGRHRRPPSSGPLCPAHALPRATYRPASGWRPGADRCPRLPFSGATTLTTTTDWLVSP
jgi:hypothetical protein